MRIRLLPAAFPGRTPVPYLTSFVVDDVLAIDAGSLGLADDEALQNGLRDVFLSHTHADHTATLPIFVETAHLVGGRPVRVHAAASTLDCLRRDVFNDRVWPDLERIQNPDRPFMELATFNDEEAVVVGRHRVIPIRVNHTIDCSGFVIDDGASSVLISSDTAPTERIWEVARRLDRLKAVFIEASFPNDAEPLAVMTGHLTPALLVRELEKVGRRIDVFAYHLKPRYHATLERELREAGGTRVVVADPREVYVL